MSPATSPAPRCWAIVPAAGSGQRMSAERPKPYLPLHGATVLEHALKPLVDHPRIHAVVVALAPGDERWAQLRYADHPRVQRATGGDERMHSVANALVGLATRAEAEDWVLVHDAARPCLSRADLERLLAALSEEPVGGLLAVPVSETVKRSDASGQVRATLEREGLWCAQTPQVFRYGILKRALTDAQSRGITVTDEAQAVEALGLAPRLIEGSSTNIKITRPADLILAEAILARNSS